MGEFWDDSESDARDASDMGLGILGLTPKFSLSELLIRWPSVLVEAHDLQSSSTSTNSFLSSEKLKNEQKLGPPTGTTWIDMTIRTEFFLVREAQCIRAKGVRK